MTSLAMSTIGAELETDYRERMLEVEVALMVLGGTKARVGCDRRRKAIVDGRILSSGTERL